MQSIVAAQIGDERRALDYLRFTLMVDLADIAGTTSDGTHIAAAGGVWQALVFGFGGVEDHDGGLSINPRLPSVLESLAYSLRYCDRQLRIELRHDRERYVLAEGDPVTITIRGRPHRLERGSALCLDAARS